MFKKTISRTLTTIMLATAGTAVSSATYAFEDGRDFKALAEHIMKKMDANKDGMMSKEEFMKMVSEKFDKMDVKKAGKMDMKQFEEFLKALMQTGS